MHMYVIPGIKGKINSQESALQSENIVIALISEKQTLRQQQNQNQMIQMDRKKPSQQIHNGG